MAKIPIDGILCNGALVGTGLLGVLLWRRNRLPKYIGIISVGAASIGLGRTLWQVLGRRDDQERSEIELDAPDSCHEQTASQVNEELSGKDNSCGIRELRRHDVDDTKEFDPVAHLQSGTKQTEVSDGQEAISIREISLQNSADRSRPKIPTKTEAKPEECASNDNSELSIEEFDEEYSSKSEVKRKENRNFVLNITEMKLRLEKDLASRSEELKSQKIKLLKEWETVYPEIEKEISGFKWSENGLKVKKILGFMRS